jgi:hypothetical protein
MDGRSLGETRAQQLLWECLNRINNRTIFGRERHTRQLVTVLEPKVEVDEIGISCCKSPYSVTVGRNLTLRTLEWGCLCHDGLTQTKLFDFSILRAAQELLPPLKRLTSLSNTR